jgi:eukaryotic-like serine/threonine-protein kinase
VRRQELYNLFGAARFGFHEALSGWRDNRAARDGLHQAIEVMVDHELGVGEPRAAAAILAELERPPAALAARVARGVAEAAVRQRALEQIAHDHDADIGTRTRMFGTLLLGAAFTVLPTIAAVREPTALTASNAGWTIWSGVLLLAVVAFGVWARQSMTRTAFNRRVFMTTIFVFVMQGALFLGAWRLDIDPQRASILMMLGWASIAGMAAIAIDARLWPCAVGYALGFGVAATWPETRFWMMAASNAVLTVNAVISWRPAVLFPNAASRQR